MEVDSITGTVVRNIPFLIMRNSEERKYFILEMNPLEYRHLDISLRNNPDYFTLMMKSFFDITGENVKGLYIDDRVGIEKYYTSTLELGKNKFERVSTVPGIVTTMVGKGKIFVDDDFPVNERKFRRYFGLKKNDIEDLKFRDVKGFVYDPEHKEFEGTDAYKKIEFKGERMLQVAPETSANFGVYLYDDKELLINKPPEEMLEPKPGPILGIHELDALALSNEIIKKYGIGVRDVYFEINESPDNGVITPENGFARIEYKGKEKISYVDTFVGALDHYTKNFYAKFAKMNKNLKNPEVA